MNPERTNFDSTPLPWDRQHTTDVRSRSESAHSPQRCANPGTHWHRPKWNVRSCCGNPCDRACCRSTVNKSRYPGDSRGKSIAQRPWRETDLGTISFVIDNRRNSDSHIFQIHRWAGNPLAERRQYDQCSWAIISRISRGPLAAGRAKMGPDEFKSKKAGMAAKSCNN